MKLKKMKKGFTIVELVIVIAVIGVLTAILVPTFINLTAKANKASDDSLVQNLNTALKMEEAEQGAKNPTMHDAVLDLENEGYKLSQLVTKSKKDLLWNMETNQFELEEGQTGPNYWKICHNLPTDSKGFSVYAADDWSGAKEITVHSGFDAGYRSDFTSISYTRESTDPAQEVVIRTNGTASVLTVNAVNDIVHHYDYLDGLTVEAVAGDSYHEHGTVAKEARIRQGNFEVEGTGKVSTIVVDATSAEDVSIDLTRISTEDAPIIYAEDEAIVAALSTIVTASQEIKDSSIKEVTYTKHVSTVEDLATALNTNGYVVLDEDVVVSEPIWIADIVDDEANLTDHKVTLDLDGNTISVETTFSGRPIMNCADLTITGNGTISSANASADNGWGAVRNYNKLLIENGTFMGSPYGGGSAIDNMMGELTINDGWFGGTGSLNNRDDGVAVINGGQFISEACSKLPYSAYAYALRSSGKITINYAYVRGAHGGVAIYGGEAIINNVDSEAYNCSTAEGQMVDHSGHGNVSYYALYVAGESTSTNCVVNGGKFKSNRLYAVLIGNSTPGDGGNRQKAHVTIYGGEFTSPSNKEVISLNGSLGSAYLFGGKYSNNNVLVGSAQMHLLDIASYDVTETFENNWYVLK